MWHSVAAVAGGFLVHFTLGTVYTFGNMNPYITSYMRQYTSSKELTYSLSTWIFSVSVFGQGTAMSLGGVLERRLGPRLTALLGSWCMSCGVLLTYFSVQSGFTAVMLTYGLMFGVGTGIAYAVAIATSMSWFPNRRGLVGGCVVAGFGGGSVVFNQVQTLFINPDNLQPNYTVAGDRYFTQDSVLQRVPGCFLLLGGTYACVQLLGAVLLRPGGWEQIGEVEADDEHEDERPTPSSDSLIGRRRCRTPGALTSPRFWLLWATFFVNTQTVVYVSTQYKSYGLASGLDDRFLATVGSLSSISNAATRVAWGQLHDTVGYWRMMLALCCCMAALMATVPLNAGAGWYYAAWICLMFGCFAGNFAMFPAVCARLFGQQAMIVSFGLLCTGNALSSIIAAPLSQFITSHFHWVGLFVTGSIFSAVGAALTVAYKLVDPSR